jgi:formylglycine-generating enzyme required for sulfatase activity
MSRSSQQCPTPLNLVAYVKSGRYSVGSNNIPNASPQHHRDLRSYWIDQMPVSFGHFERFVVGGGYDDKSLWLDTIEPPLLRSIDQRCDELLEQSVLAAGLFRDKPTRSVDIPLVGVSWGEAAAIARFAGGRLPFESEWEVAMQRYSKVSTRENNRADSSGMPRCWQQAQRSDWGCVVPANVLQEWTADAFSPVYWRSESDRHGMAWTPGQAYGVSLRGSCHTDMHKDFRFRRAADPNEGHSARGFRRVWDAEPSPTQYSSHFVLP